MTPDKKIKIHTFPIDHLFESEQDIELYRRFLFPHLLQPAPPPNSSQPPTLWLKETIIYLGLDRIELKRPDKAIHRLIKKGALHPKKISGRLCFDRAELDKVLALLDNITMCDRVVGSCGVFVTIIRHEAHLGIIGSVGVLSMKSYRT